MEFDLENPLAASSEFGEEEDDDDDESRHALFLVESDQMTQKIFLESSRTNDFLVTFRQEAISVMSQAYYSGNLNRSVMYLATNYIDRFIISLQDLQNQAKPWMRRLIILACISLASKMKILEFSAIKFQEKEGPVFNARTIQRMELIVLDALNWRMRSITPLSFTRFFISRLKIKDPSSLQALKDRTTDIIFESQKEIRLFEFRASVVAAAALLVAANGLFPPLFPSFKSSILSCKYVNNDNVLRCVSMIEEIRKIEGCEETSIGSDAPAKCSTTPAKIKRRRINQWPIG